VSVIKSPRHPQSDSRSLFSLLSAAVDFLPQFAMASDLGLHSATPGSPPARSSVSAAARRNRPDRHHHRRTHKCAGSRDIVLLCSTIRQKMRDAEDLLAW
jgi:hypothetical protein